MIEPDDLIKTTDDIYLTIKVKNENEMHHPKYGKITDPELIELLLNETPKEAMLEGNILLFFKNSTWEIKHKHRKLVRLEV